MQQITAYFNSRASTLAIRPECVLRLTCGRDGDLGISCEEEECSEKNFARHIDKILCEKQQRKFAGTVYP